MPETTRDRIIEAAGRLFAERGYSAVSIRDVAAKAEVSPSLVMKLVGSKEGLFRASTRFEPQPLLVDVPLAGLGRALVADILRRRAAAEPDVLARAVVLLLPAPDPEEIRRLVREAYVEPLARRLDQATAETVIALLAGLSVSVRLYRQLDEATIASEQLVARYGALVQAVIDQGTPQGSEGGGSA
ncbi:DNA-binding transcriptional regulator, AcrR family [Raineyella antarctica]|uniref:DNA-binding transcriptional regulator, AcrR family n=1 Tax=Raineyella antarctica TaxID=1577474 RepID=A0A1G6GF96_9ACTN|nr:TetR/AcrR family transcriptional regulator [Raineyella antarctica]SDB80640.1 DNA-binding transcriptional regulator, AcrR family [Raineyella antarctica]